MVAVPFLRSVMTERHTSPLKAFEAIDQAEEEYQSLLHYPGFPGFDPLRDDPRFVEFLERLELPIT